MKKILLSALVHVWETSGLGFFEPELHDKMKRQMVAALYKDENFTKRAIKKQQLEKPVCGLNAINWLFPKNENGSKISINELWFLE